MIENIFTRMGLKTVIIYTKLEDGIKAWQVYSGDILILTYRVKEGDK